MPVRLPRSAAVRPWRPRVSPAEAGTRFFQSLREAGVTLLVTHAPDERVRARLAEWGSSFGSGIAAYPRGADLHARAGLLWGEVTATAAETFPAIRGLALRGARLVCVHGEPPRDAILRGRALENRIFIAAASRSKASLVGVNGEWLAASSSGDGDVSLVQIDRSLADDKCVAPGTDVFRQRRPELYRL